MRNTKSRTKSNNASGRSSRSSTDQNSSTDPPLPPLPALDQLESPILINYLNSTNPDDAPAANTAQTATSRIGVSVPPPPPAAVLAPGPATASSTLQQQQQQQQQQRTHQLNPTSTSATPAPILATATNQDKKILRVIAAMFRQHADLYLQQASYLERMSCSFLTNSNNHPDLNSTNEIDITTTVSASPDIIPSREELQDKIRRESVVDLARKSYQGMKEVQSLMDVILVKKKVHGGGRRRFAFELFEQDILHSIIKEAKYKEISRKQAKLRKNKKNTKSKGSDEKDKNSNDCYKSEYDKDPLAAYIFQRTQEEWKKLNKKTIALYANRAEGEDGIKHIKKKKSQRIKSAAKRKEKTASNNHENENESVAETEPLFKKRKEDPSSNSDAIVDEKDHRQHQNILPHSRSNKTRIDGYDESSDDYDESSDDYDDSTDDGDDGDDSDRNKKSLAHSKIIQKYGIDTSNTNRINTTGEDNSDNKSDSDDQDVGLDLLSMPPIPKTTIFKRERDESSSSEDERESASETS